MLLSSVGLVGFASEEAPAATEAPAADAAATEAPAADATEAPAEGADTTQTAPGPAANVDNSAYDNDDYYRRALDMTTSLGIITGYEDGSVQPGSNVTRAEMASIVLRMLGISAAGSYSGIYSDVAEGHWAATQIQAATDQGIINGMGDGTFMPDGNVTYAQVCVMLVRALNYEEEAEQYGGWPNGYLNIASGVLDITDNASGQSEVAAERGLVIKMVYNALVGPYKERVGYGALGQSEYNTNKTLAESRFDVKKGKGVLKATATTTLTDAKLLAGQLLIDVDDDSLDDDEGTLYTTDLTNVDGYVGTSVTYYYQDKTSAAEKVVTMFSTGNKTRTEELDVEDIQSMTGFDGSGEPSIKMYGSSSAKKFESDTEPTIVYNGQVITNADFEALPDDDARKWKNVTVRDTETGEETVEKQRVYLNEFLKPKMGSVKLIDTNSNGKYETIVIEKYETMLITAATANRLSGKIDNISTSLTKLDDADKIVTVTREGATVRVRNLKTNDVASIKRDLNNEVIDIVVTAESFTGKITSRGSVKEDSDDDLMITVDGTDKYAVDKNALDDATAGKDCVFYTDSFGRIGYIEAASANGMLASGEAYGWIMSAYTSEDGESRMLKIITADGAEDYELADRVDIWLNGEDDNRTVSGTDLDKVCDDMSAATKDVASTFFMRSYTGSGDSKVYANQIRLAKFKANANKEITKLYLAVDSDEVEDEAALRIKGSDLKNTPSQGSSVGGFQVPDGILEITAPNNLTDMRSASNYAFGSVTSSAYVVRENGTTRSFVLGEFEDAVTPTILINFATSATAAEVFTNLDSAQGGPSIMVVDSVDLGYDDDDNEVYTINGYLSGAETSVKTNRNTNIGWLPNNFWTASNNGRNFDAYSLWKAENGYHKWVSNPDAPETDEIVSSDESIGDVTDILDEGDLILYSGDGKLIAKYIDASVMSDYVENGEDATGFPKIVDSQPTKRDPLATRTLTFNPLGQHTNNSSSRVGFYFAKVTDVDSETAWVKLEGVANPIVFDPTKVLDVVEVSGSKVDTDTEGAGSAADIQVGDYLFVSTANKGDINSIIIYRID